LAYTRWLAAKLSPRQNIFNKGCLNAQRPGGKFQMAKHETKILHLPTLQMERKEDTMNPNVLSYWGFAQAIDLEN